MYVSEFAAGVSVPPDILRSPLRARRISLRSKLGENNSGTECRFALRLRDSLRQRGALREEFFDARLSDAGFIRCGIYWGQAQRLSGRVLE
jgi:hypothetical protein